MNFMTTQGLAPLRPYVTASKLQLRCISPPLAFKEHKEKEKLWPFLQGVAWAAPLPLPCPGAGG